MWQARATACHHTEEQVRHAPSQRTARGWRFRILIPRTAPVQRAPRTIMPMALAHHVICGDRVTTRKSTGHIPFFMAHGIERLLFFDVTEATFL
ncbi:hypothetical protein F4604DRAFT_1723781, partial [Suillus subluteus]